MKYLNGFAWTVTIVVVALTFAYWDEIKFAWKNRAVIKTAIETGSAISNLGSSL